MKKMNIYEPAMCCPTGVCGVGVDPELLRISTVLNNLEKKGIEIGRFQTLCKIWSSGGNGISKKY